MRHLLSIDQLGRDGIVDLVERARWYRDNRPHPILTGRTVMNCFFEDSTRTRVSFELAAKRLGAITVQFVANESSLSKGESIRNTVETLDAMQLDVLVVRHREIGMPARISDWTSGSVINAGDGTNEHPTQALLDCMTLLDARRAPDLGGLRVAMVGDFDHSRVAGSTTRAMQYLGAEVIAIGPASLTTNADEKNEYLDEVIGKVDVVYSIRPQFERMGNDEFGSLEDYVEKYSITETRLAEMPDHGLIMDAGPLVPDLQMARAVEDSPRCLVNTQVRNGVVMRMAVLDMLIGAPR